MLNQYIGSLSISVRIIQIFQVFMILLKPGLFIEANPSTTYFVYLDILYGGRGNLTFVLQVSVIYLGRDMFVNVSFMSYSVVTSVVGLLLFLLYTCLDEISSKYY